VDEKTSLVQRGGLVTSAIESLLRSGTLIGLSEQDLVERFVREGDRRAFEAIVARHGPLVLAVCQQILADSNDADDAFQATFLVLIRRASSVRRPGSLASWLHGVAYRIALRIKRGNRPCRLLHDPPGRQAPCPVEERENLVLLHQEIDRLPPKYRLPIVLCYLEGMTHDVAASQLHWPVGTVRGRLARARDQLRERLTRREVTLAVGFMNKVWLDQATLSESQVRAIVDLLENNASPRISNLVQGVLTAMLVEKLKWLVFVFSTACLVLLAAGSGLLARARTGPENVAAHSTVQVKTEGRKDTDHRKGVARREAEIRALPKAENASPDREPETRADSLEELRVKSELLEMETALLKQSIQESAKTVKQYESWGWGADDRNARGGEGGGQSNKDSLRLSKKKLEEEQEEYLIKRLELARLKRQIARQSKDLDRPGGERADLAEVGQRLDALEKKVEKILQLLARDKEDR
jgi:RNA polymerase sigma factor (sigma-70 family)